MRKLLAATIVILLAVAAGEGFLISSLYTSNSNYGAQVQSLQAEVSELRGSLYPMTVVDDLNRTVTIPGQPQRVASLEPSDTQIVYTIGEGSKLVGVTDYDTWPAALNASLASGRLAQVGGILDSSISVETVIGLRPDLVLAWGIGGEESNTIQQLAGAGIPVLALAPQNMTMVYNDVLLVGRALDAYQNATDAVKEMGTIANFVSSRLQGATTPRVFYEVWNDPLITATPSSFLGQLVNQAGGRDTFSNSTEQFPTVSPEAVVSMNPQVIILDSDLNMTAAQVAAQPGFSATAAAKTGSIYILTDSSVVNQPGPRLIQGLLVLAQLIHPSVFGNVNPDVFNDDTGQFSAASLGQFS